MGCFSSKCQVCGKGVLSTSFAGERVKIFLLKDGKVIQQMEGEYDSYGRVFKNNTQRKDVSHKLRESYEWKPIDSKYEDDAWSEVCDLEFSDDISNGQAYIHSDCFTGELPTVRSVRDPNQGWGDEDDDENLLGNTSSKISSKKRKIVLNYCVITDHAIEYAHETIWELKKEVERLKLYKEGQILGMKTFSSVNYDEQIANREKEIKLAQDMLVLIKETAGLE